MRPRIRMAVVSAKPTGTIFFNCNKEEIERNNRRAQFERNRKACLTIIKSKPELNSFGMGVMNAISEWRKTRYK